MTGPSARPPSWAPLHFAVFSKSCPSSPQLGSPLLPFVSFPCYPQNRQGPQRWDPGPSDQLWHGPGHFISQPRVASGVPIQPCQFPTLGWGPPASGLEMHPLILEALPLTLPQDADAVLEAPPALSPYSPHSLSPLTENAAGAGRQLPSKFTLSHQRGISDSQPWALSPLFIQVVAFLMDCHFQPALHPCWQGMATCHL